MSEETIFIYIPCAPGDEAKRIGRTLVEEKLVACANVIPGLLSIYEWEGKTALADENVLLLKTRKDLFDRVQARVMQLHSYKTPCIAALPLERLNEAYASWVAANTLR